MNIDSVGYWFTEHKWQWKSQFGRNAGSKSVYLQDRFFNISSALLSPRSWFRDCSRQHFQRHRIRHLAAQFSHQVLPSAHFWPRPHFLLKIQDPSKIGVWGQEFQAPPETPNLTLLPPWFPSRPTPKNKNYFNLKIKLIFLLFSKYENNFRTNLVSKLYNLKRKNFCYLLRVYCF